MTNMLGPFFAAPSFVTREGVDAFWTRMQAQHGLRGRLPGRDLLGQLWHLRGGSAGPTLG